MSTAAATEQWFYSQDGQQSGPVPLDQLRAMLSGGQVMWSEMVWSAGMAQWSPAHAVPALRPLSGSPGDVPPPLPPQAINYAGPPPPAHYGDISDDPKMRLLMPVGRSPWAIIAGYLGLLSPLMIFAPFVPPLMIFAPCALFTSIMAMRDIKRRNTHGMGRAIFGAIMGGLFTLGGCIAVVVVIANSS